MFKEAKPINLFIGKLAAFYFFWLISDNWLYHQFSFFNRIWAFCYHLFFISLRKLSIFLLEALGYDIVYSGAVIAIVGTAGVKIYNACVGFGLTFAFAALIVSYPGRWIHKLWFIPVGGFFILLLNGFRVVFLAKNSGQSIWFGSMEQHDAFNNLIYVLIFLLWAIWVKFVPATSFQSLPKSSSGTTEK